MLGRAMESDSAGRIWAWIRVELRFASIGGDHRARDGLQSPRREIRTRVMIVLSTAPVMGTPQCGN